MTSSKFGIILRDVQNVMRGFENFSRETLPTTFQAIMSIITHFPHEELIVNTISMSCYTENNQGYEYLFTFIDYFKKYALAISSKKMRNILL